MAVEKGGAVCETDGKVGETGGEGYGRYLQECSFGCVNIRRI